MYKMYISNVHHGYLLDLHYFYPNRTHHVQSAIHLASEKRYIYNCVLLYMPLLPNSRRRVFSFYRSGSYDHAGESASSLLPPLLSQTSATQFQEPPTRFPSPLAHLILPNLQPLAIPAPEPRILSVRTAPAGDACDEGREKKKVPKSVPEKPDSRPLENICLELDNTAL